jgi:hypothetical protein
MSVTFSPEFVDGPHQIGCPCNGAAPVGQYPDYRSAYQAAVAGARNGCKNPYCEFFAIVEVNAAPDVNVSNHNAAEILDVLGIRVGDRFEDRCAGSMSGEDFLGRVLVALAVAPVDAGVPAVRVGNFVECGRPEGYAQVQLGALRTVAQYAADRKLQLVWG